MRRRDAVNVWPSFADLMTVLAVPGLSLAIGAYFYLIGGGAHAPSAASPDPSPSLSPSTQLPPPVATPSPGVVLHIQDERMARAVEQAESRARRIAEKMKLPLGPDQSILFGEDLLTFSLSGVQLVWQPGGEARLRQICAVLSSSLAQIDEDALPRRASFVIEVQGHTDSTQCADDANCNWRISAARAVAFVAYMRSERNCPDARTWDLRPLAFGDTRPLRTGRNVAANRRVVVRILPNYEALIQRVRARK